jgi:hypothetical protein
MYFETERSLPNYLVQSNSKYVIYTSSPRDMFFAFTFFKNSIDPYKVQLAMQKGMPYSLNNFIFSSCKEMQLKSGVIVSDTCLDDLTYIKLAKSKAKRIEYTNYSFRTAFFILN